MASHVVVSLPFFLAGFYYASSPFFSRLTSETIKEHLEKVSASWVSPDEPGKTSSPVHLEPESLAQLADWVADAPQLVPTLLMPVAGALFAVSTSGTITTAILAAFALIVVIACLWIYRTNPMRYTSYRIFRGNYTLVPFVGILLNLAAAILLLVVD